MLTACLLHQFGNIIVRSAWESLNLMANNGDGTSNPVNDDLGMNALWIVVKSLERR